MRMSVKEINTLAKWCEEKNMKDNHEVIIETTQTGIGSHVEARVRLTETEGIFIDLTDYDSW